MRRLKFSIRTLSPVVLTSTSNATVMTGTHAAFSGSIIRGIMASRFVEVQKLHDEAHDETFREIFFGGLRFLPANPEIFGERSFVLPLSLQSGKSGTDDGDKVQDLLDDENSRKGYKSFRGYGVRKDGKFFTARVKTNMFMHMSRSDKVNVDGKEIFERLAGKSSGGGIYNYEALDAGQNFCGEIVGDEKLLMKLRDGLNLDGDKMIAYVGRSKFTQYGKCLVMFGEIERLNGNFSDRIFLRLDTPLIPVDDCFISAEKILTTEIIGKLGGRFSLGKFFASGGEVENFVVPWSMKRPRVSTLAAGTVFELKISAPLTADDKKFLLEKIYGGFGMRTEEGYGQLRLWTPENSTKGKLDDDEPSQPKFSDDTIKLAKKILAARLLEQVRIYAHEDAKKLGMQLERGNMAHFFTRLGKILSAVGKENVRENFRARLELEIRPHSQFEKHLDTLRMSNNRKFLEVLTCQAPLPVDSRSMSDELDLKKIRPLIDKLKLPLEDLSKDKIHWEYLTNYFRFARKIAASKGGAERG